MKIRTLFLTLALFLAVIPALLAKGITKEQARTVAFNFLTERIANHQVNWGAGSLMLQEVTMLEADELPAIYVFSNHGQGFILVAADDEMTPVLGYAYEGTFPEHGSNPNYDSFLGEFLDQVKFVRQNNEPVSDDVQSAWEKYQDNQMDFSVLSDTTTLGPLLTCLWNQDNPYNEFCPEDPAGPGGHCYVGCVATAMSMIMGYYRYPLTGNGSSSYNCPGYGNQYANFGATAYDWDAMQNTVGNASGQGIPANAELQFQAGVSVKMQYAPDGSSAFSEDVPYALKTYFKYSPSVQYVSRGGYTVTNWENMLIEQLDALKPVYYAGKEPSSTAGHAFVCDGYQIIGTAKTFHYNFGWSGSGNGYYTYYITSSKRLIIWSFQMADFSR